MGQRVCITGGSGGIGRAAVKAFAAAGFQVVFTYLTQSAAAASLAAEVRASGGEAIAVQADLTDSRQVEMLFAKAAAVFGGIDVLVNNAGIAAQGLLMDLPESEWDRILDVNLKSVYLCCKAALPYMVSKKKGCIINVSSMWGQAGASCEAAYSAAKAGVIGLSKALAKEMGPSHIRVNCIAPGVIDTPMNAGLSEADLQALREETPLETIGRPEDVAALMLFLASDRAAFITGQVLGVNGGYVI